MKTTKKSFSNWRAGAFHLDFPNGNHLSTTFAPGSYSENHNVNFPLGNGFIPYSSNSCEIMFDCPEKLSKKIFRKYALGSDNSVIGYLDIKQWSEIVALLSK